MLHASITTGAESSVADIYKIGFLDNTLHDGRSRMKHANGRISRPTGMIKNCVQVITNHTCGRYVDIFSDRADTITESLKKTRNHWRYPRLLHMQGVDNGYVPYTHSFVNSEERYSRWVCLPSTTNLTDDDLSLVAEEVLKALV